jgi:hypothetical protein
MANVVTNSTADRTIPSANLLPASRNTSQSLGNPAAPWNVTLVAKLGQLNGGAVICLTGSSDPYGGLIHNAISALSASGLSGGAIDARSAGCAAVAQGNIDPGSLAITTLLGPNTYTVTSITVCSSLIICGAGKGICVMQASGSANQHSCLADSLRQLEESGFEYQFHASLWPVSSKGVFQDMLIGVYREEATTNEE